MVRAGMPPRPQPKLGEPLTLRELEVLYELVEGETVAAVATRLEISEQTMKNHIGNIHKKTGRHSLVGVYRQQGWLRSPTEQLGAQMNHAINVAVRSPKPDKPKKKRKK